MKTGNRIFVVLAVFVLLITFCRAQDSASPAVKPKPDHYAAAAPKSVDEQAEAVGSSSAGLTYGKTSEKYLRFRVQCI